MELPREFADQLAELNGAGIDYGVVGGVAVNLLGYQRATADVDVLAPSTREHARRVLALLENIGGTRPDGSALAPTLFDGEHHVRALTPHGIIDFVPEGEGPLLFANVREAARLDEIHGTPVWRADLAHLIALKRLAGRPRDLDDLEKLELACGKLPDLDLRARDGLEPPPRGS